MAKIWSNIWTPMQKPPKFWPLYTKIVKFLPPPPVQKSHNFYPLPPLQYFWSFLYRVFKVLAFFAYEESKYLTKFCHPDQIVLAKICPFFIKFLVKFYPLPLLQYFLSFLHRGVKVFFCMEGQNFAHKNGQNLLKYLQNLFKNIQNLVKMGSKMFTLMRKWPKFWPHYTKMAKIGIPI